MSSPVQRPPLYALFFVSGATSLVYQVLWARELHLVFGTSTFAVATVLAAFMAGLGIGGLAIERVVEKLERPLRLYGQLELFIGCWALLFPVLVGALDPAQTWLWSVLQPSPLQMAGLQLLLMGSIILPPTIAMGATLPLLVRTVSARPAEAGEAVGTLYAVNTAGALTGAALAGFVLLPQLGLALSTFVSAVANLMLGGTAVTLSRQLPAAPLRTEPVELNASQRIVRAQLDRAMVMVMFTAGVGALICEVAWTRLLSLVLGPSVYAFTAMLLAYLGGIALGGRLGGVFGDRWRRWEGVTGVLGGLALLQVSVALSTWGLMWLYSELPWVFLLSFRVLDGAESGRLLWLGSVALSALVMTPPAVFMGMSFPVAARVVMSRESGTSAPVGRLYAANTFGGVVGALVGGFWLLPGPGLQTAILVAVALFIANAVGMWAWLAARDRQARAAVVLGVLLGPTLVVARPDWDPLWMTSGVYQYAGELGDATRSSLHAFAVDGFELLLYEEGLATVVTVARNTETGVRWLANNGKVDASSAGDMPTQALCALLPWAAARDPEEALVIGLASGVTAGALVPTDAQRIDVVELEPAITDAARYFADVNNGVLDDPRTRLFANDGRHHVKLSPPGAYDVIVSEPSNPWITGVSNLFTREFWQEGSRRLGAGGVWSQWVQLYGLEPPEVRSLLGTFVESFAHVQVWSPPGKADLILLASHSPLPAPEQTVARLYGDERLALELAKLDYPEPTDLLSLYLTDRDGLVEVTEGYTPNTDDNMRIEHRAPLSLYSPTRGRSFGVLEPVLRLPAGLTAETYARLAVRYSEHADPRLDEALTRVDAG